MPRPTIGQTLHFVVVGSITEPPGGTWAESDGLIGMIHNTQVPIHTPQAPSPYGWTYNNAPSLKPGLDNTGSKTPAVSGWNTFKAAREAGNPGINPVLGFYKGIFSFKDEAFAEGAYRWPPANFFPSEIPNDYRIPSTGVPATAVADYSKAGAVDFYRNLALSVINGGYGHPAEELLHFDEVGMLQANWPYLVSIFSGAKAALGANKYLSLNIGGWNFFAPLSWISHSTAISNIASMCHYFGSERTPVMGDLPIEKGLYVDNYKVIINNFRTLMIGGCGPELVPQLHLVQDKFFPQYEIDTVTYIDSSAYDMDYFGMESRMPPYGRKIATNPNDHKLLLKFKTPCYSCNPTIGCNPVGRFKISDPGPVGWPVDGWTAWPKQPAPGQEPMEMYVFRTDETLTALKARLHPNFAWIDLKDNIFYDTSYYERMQAATILFAAPSMNAPGGVHHSIGRFHPGHMSTNLGYPNMDWRKWGAILGAPIDSSPTYVPSSGQTMLQHVYRQFTNFKFNWYPQQQRFVLEH